MEEAFLRRGVGIRAGSRSRAPLPEKENFVLRKLHKLRSGRVVKVWSSTTRQSPLPSDYPRVPLQNITSALKLKMQRCSGSTGIRPRVRVQAITPLRQLRIHGSPDEETAAAYDTTEQENESSSSLAMLRELLLLADEDTVLGTDKSPLPEEIQSAAETEDVRKEKSRGIASEAEAKSARRDNATGIAQELGMKENCPIPSARWHIPSRNIQQNRGLARHSNLKPLTRMR